MRKKQTLLKQRKQRYFVITNFPFVDKHSPCITKRIPLAHANLYFKTNHHYRKYDT